MLLNDIRQDKNVSVAQIEKLGISKSRWYRIAVGEAELSLKELTDAAVDDDLFGVGNCSWDTIVTTI